MDWVTAVKADAEAYETFKETLNALRNRALRQMEEARSWEDVIGARGQKKFADQLLAFVTMSEEEERALLRFKQGGK